MPALAQTKPCLVSVMMTPLSGAILTIPRLSLNISSTSLGSLPLSIAMRVALVEGSTSRRSTTRPSAFDTTFCVTTSMSPAETGVPCPFAAFTISSATSSPASISGMPRMPIISTRAWISRASGLMAANVAQGLWGVNAADKGGRNARDILFEPSERRGIYASGRGFGRCRLEKMLVAKLAACSVFALALLSACGEGRMFETQAEQEPIGTLTLDSFTALLTLEEVEEVPEKSTFR